LAGRTVKVVQGVQTRYFKYDALGRLLRINQPEQERNPNLDLADSFNSTGFWTAGFAYDVLGNVVRATDANGVNIVNEYDRASRVTKRCYTKPNISTTATTCAQIVSSGDLSLDTPTVTFFYDGKGVTEQTPNYAKGKLTKVDNTYSQTRYTLFDNFGRLTQMEQRTPLDGETTETTTPRVSSYQYNLSGALTEETYPSGRVVKNEFEPDGDLMNVASKKAGGAVFTPYVSNFRYTASGGISQMELGNGKWETAKFNNRMQVTELGLGASATDAGTWKVAYEYGELDSNGNTVAAKNTGNIAKQTLSFTGLTDPLVQAYRYDPLYRLTEAKENPSGNPTPNWIQNWTYDIYGNRETFTQNIPGSPAAVNPAVDPNKNRFYLGQGFVYDKNGNVTQDVDPTTSQNRTFVFNGDNKQTKVRDASNNVVGEYFYDGEGKRIKKYVPSTGETTIFVYSSGKLVAEYSTVVEPPETAKVAYTTTDHLGSPRVIADQFGQVRSRRDFLPFGESININVGARSTALNYGSTTDNVRQKFTGYQKDAETSLDFAEARMYENRFGRFTAVDPLLASGKSANPQTFNRFIYVGNNPIITTDPLGLDWYRQQIGTTDRYNYAWYDKDPGGTWKGVEFAIGSLWTTAPDWCSADSCDGKTAYLYKSGGRDLGERAARMEGLTRFFATYSAMDPRQIAARDPQVREGAADVIGGIAGFGINSVTGTYNFAAGGVNYFSGSERLPYAWEYTPETGGQRAFYYGAMGLTGGYAAAGAVRGIASGVNTIRSGGLSFNAYRAAQGPSEILGQVNVMTKSGRQIPFAIRTEQSHMFITQKMQRKYDLPNWLVNNRINVWKLNTIQHALIDPSRLRTLPVGLKPQVGWVRNRFTFFSNDF
jgi:RHS repeat-associated protein